MPLPKVTMAAAGSGKTHDLVETALGYEGGRVLVVTYTDQNLMEIRERIVSKKGCLPHNIDLLSWYTFLIRHCIRPYQYPLYPNPRIERPFFPSGQDQDAAIRNRRYVGRDNIQAYYIVGNNQIVGEFASDFAVKCNESNGGAVIDRLAQIYGLILIDEVQDLAGYDLDLLELLFAANVTVGVVGDCRQVTYKTNGISRRHRGYRDEKIIDFFRLMERGNKCEVEFKTTSRRCVQGICDFADALYADMPATTSENDVDTGHNGVFIIRSSDVAAYYETHNPQVLRWDRRTSTCCSDAVNFGEAKGCTYDRTLLYITNPIRSYIEDTTSLSSVSRAKFYVAITRARFSTAIVYDGPIHESFTSLGVNVWTPRL